MAQAKIEFSLGKLSFSGEGDEGWLANQLDKVLEAAPKLSAAQSETEGAGDEAPEEDEKEEKFTTPLGTYLKTKGGEDKQVRRFLVTADWLRRRGTKDMSTVDVTKALSANHQKGLSNPTSCLNQNITKGFCEKKGKRFFITPDGLKELGH